MNKKAITILGAIFLLIVGTLGFLLYQRSQTQEEDNLLVPPPAPQPQAQTPTPVAPPPTSTTPPPGTPTPTPTPPSGSPEPTPTPPTPTTSGVVPVKLTSESVVGPILFYQGNGIAYFTPSGRLFQGDLDSSTGEYKMVNLRELAVPTKSNLTKVLWPASGNNYLLETSGGRSIYVSNKGTYVDMPSQVTAAGWLPDGEQVVYLWLEGGKTTLNVSPADLSTWQVVTEIWENDDDISVSPDGKAILFWRTGSSEATNSINLVTPDGKLFRSVVKEGYNQGAVFSNDSKRFLFNRKGSGGQWELWVGDLFTNETKSLNASVPVASAVWSPDNRYVYASTEGSFLRIDPNTGDQQSIEILGDVEGVEMFMTFDGKNLFFKNKVDGGLYYIKLPEGQ